MKLFLSPKPVLGWFSLTLNTQVFCLMQDVQSSEQRDDIKKKKWEKEIKREKRIRDQM